LDEATTSGPRIEVEARGELLSQEIDGEMVLLDLRSGMYLGLNLVELSSNRLPARALDGARAPWGGVRQQRRV
jgi:hypothetical protein